MRPFASRIAVFLGAIALTVTSGVSAGNKKFMTINAAKVLAERALVESVVGLKLVSTERVEDMVAAGVRIDAQTRARIKGIRFTDLVYDRQRDIAKATAEIRAGRVTTIVGRQVNFGDRTLRRFAFATSTDAAAGPLRALRAAELDAYRQLAKQVVGFRLESRSSVENFILKSDDVRASVMAAIYGAEMKAYHWDEDGNAYVTLSLRVSDLKDILGQEVYTGADHIEAEGMSAQSTDDLRAARLRVVDCRVPADRRGPERMVRATVSDCGNRQGTVAVGENGASERLENWLSQAQAGNPVAQTYVGEMYQRGRGVPQDYAQAAEWYTKAAKQGDRRAQLNLGYLVENGLGVEKELPRALKLYEEASGLEKEGVPFSTSVEVAETPPELSVSVDAPTVEDPLQRQLEASKEQLKAVENPAQDEELQKVRGELEVLQKRLAEVEFSGAGERERALALEKQLNERTEALARQNALREEMEHRLTLLQTQRLQAEQEVIDIRDQLRTARSTSKVVAEEDQSAKQRLQKKIAALEDSLAQANSAVESLRTERETKEVELKGDLAQARETEAVLRKDLAARDQELETLRQQSASQTDQERVLALRGQVDELRKSLRTLAGKFDSDRAALEKRLSISEQSRQDLQGLLETQKGRSSSLEQTVADLGKDLEERQKAAAALEEALSRLRKESKTNTTMAARLRDREKLLKQQQEDLNQIQTQARRDLDRAEEKLTQSRVEEERLRADLAERDAALTVLRNGLRQAEYKLVERERQMREASEQAELEKEKLLALNATLQKQRDDERNRLAQKIAELEARLTERENTVGEQRETIARLEDDKPLAREGPRIELMDPPLALVRGIPSIQAAGANQKVEVVGRVDAKQGLRALKINERVAKIDDAGFFRTSLNTGNQSVPIKIVAVDSGGQTSALDFLLIPGKARQIEVEGGMRVAREEFGSYYALVIGNGDYGSLPKLRTAEYDAESVALALSQRYGFKTRLLLNANRYQILTALNQMRAELSPQDNLLIYYAGHGQIDRANVRGFWLPVDAEADNSANWVSNTELGDLLNVMPAKHIMVVADSCYSGLMTRTSVARISRQMDPDLQLKWMKVMSKTRSRTVLSSGGVQPVLDGGGGEHSVFASVFLQVLNDNANVLEGSSLYRKVVERMKPMTSALGVDQEPRYSPIKFSGHEAGEFFFIPDELLAKVGAGQRVGMR